MKSFILKWMRWTEQRSLIHGSVWMPGPSNKRYWISSNDGVTCSSNILLIMSQTGIALVRGIRCWSCHSLYLQLESSTLLMVVQNRIEKCLTRLLLMNSFKETVECVCVIKSWRMKLRNSLESVFVKISDNFQSLFYSPGLLTCLLYRKRAKRCHGNFVILPVETNFDVFKFSLTQKTSARGSGEWTPQTL